MMVFIFSFTFDFIKAKSPILSANEMLGKYSMTNGLSHTRAKAISLATLLAIGFIFRSGVAGKYKNPMTRRRFRVRFLLWCGRTIKAP